MISVDCWLVCNTVPSNELQHVTALQKLAWSALKGMQFHMMSCRRIQMTLSFESFKKYCCCPCKKWCLLCCFLELNPQNNVLQLILGDNSHIRQCSYTSAHNHSGTTHFDLWKPTRPWKIQHSSICINKPEKQRTKLAAYQFTLHQHLVLYNADCYFNIYYK